MRCFNHHDQPSLGICKFCGKGLCENCLADLDSGIACKGVHEGSVIELQKGVKRTLATYAANDLSKYIAISFYLLSGIVFCVWGYSSLTGAGRWGTVAVGILFLLSGFAFLVQAIKVRNRIKNKPLDQK